MVRFLRRNVTKYSKLGLRKKKKQVWRNPTGRDNKMREKRRGYPATVSIGYGTNKNTRGQINEKKPIMINNIRDLEKVQKDNIAVIGKVGSKKKMEIIKEAEKKKIEISNINLKKFLKKMDRKEKFRKKKAEETKTKKDKKEEKKTEKLEEKTDKEEAK